MPRKNLTIAEKIVVSEKLENNFQTMCTMLVYADVFVYCHQDNDVMLTSDNRISRLIGLSDASPDVTRLSRIYCISFSSLLLSANQKMFTYSQNTDFKIFNFWYDSIRELIPRLPIVKCTLQPL